VRYIHTLLMLGGTGWIPPATVYIYVCCKMPTDHRCKAVLTGFSGGAVGTIFNFFIKRRWRGWWMQYVRQSSLFLSGCPNLCRTTSHPLVSIPDFSSQPSSFASAFTLLMPMFPNGGEMSRKCYRLSATSFSTNSPDIAYTTLWI
jgi:hypothetical protein